MLVIQSCCILFILACLLSGGARPGPAGARAPAEKGCAPAVPRRTKWVKIIEEIKQRATVKLQCRRMSSQYQYDDSNPVLSIVTMIVWTHQICYRPTAVVTRLQVAQSSRAIQTAAFCGATTSNAAHGIARPFCPSVCASVKRADCDKT